MELWSYINREYYIAPVRSTVIKKRHLLVLICIAWLLVIVMTVSI